MQNTSRTSASNGPGFPPSAEDGFRCQQRLRKAKQAAVVLLCVAPGHPLKRAVPSAEGASPPGLTFVYALCRGSPAQLQRPQHTHSQQQLQGSVKSQNQSASSCYEQQALKSSQCLEPLCIFRSCFMLKHQLNLE